MGANEVSHVWAMGTELETRRLDAVAYSRPADHSGPWTSVPSSERFELGGLLQGRLAHDTAHGDREVIELQFDRYDLLRDLSHIPSVGPTRATVLVDEGVITTIDLQLGGAVTAHIGLDYGSRGVDRFDLALAGDDLTDTSAAAP